MTRLSVEFSRAGRPPCGGSPLPVRGAAAARPRVRIPAGGRGRTRDEGPARRDVRYVRGTRGRASSTEAGPVGRRRRRGSGQASGPTVRPGFLRGLSFPDGKGLSAVAPFPCRGLSRRCGTGPFAWERVRQQADTIRESQRRIEPLEHGLDPTVTLVGLPPVGGDGDDADGDGVLAAAEQPEARRPRCRRGPRRRPPRTRRGAGGGIGGGGRRRCGRVRPRRRGGRRSRGVLVRAAADMGDLPMGADRPRSGAVRGVDRPRGDDGRGVRRAIGPGAGRRRWRASPGRRASGTASGRRDGAGLCVSHIIMT